MKKIFLLITVVSLTIGIIVGIEFHSYKKAQTIENNNTSEQIEILNDSIEELKQSLEDEIKNKEDILANLENTNDCFALFDKVICIGDSLTYGTVFTDEKVFRKAIVSYPEYLEKLTGVETISYAVSGYTTANWWFDFEKKIEEGNNLYLVYLGTNGELTDTLAEDCVGSDYKNYAKTDTGYYGRIMQKIEDCGGKAILIKIYASKKDIDVANSVIEQIGDRWNALVVDAIYLEDDCYHYSPDKKILNKTHYNDLGYLKFAEILYNKIQTIDLTSLFDWYYQD